MSPPAHPVRRHVLDGALAALAALAVMAATAWAALALLGADSVAPLSRLVPVLVCLAVGGGVTLESSGGELPLTLSGDAALTPLGLTFLGTAVLATVFFRPLRRRARPTPAMLWARTGGALTTAAVALPVCAALARGTAGLPESVLDEKGEPDAGPAFALDLAPMDLRTLAADALRDVRALDATREVALTGPGGGKPASAPAHADEARLRQVVINLIGNAVAHTPPGTPIRIGVGTEGSDAVLEVADRGPGLTDAERDRVFDRFYRADDSRARATGGSGLGLAIAHALVTAHGGRITLDTAPGRGCVFRILLPPPDRT
ncbi:ATP-binding protein [Streptomyces fuscus]|uniref:ATP-binding protein n=1 Tax=Streptomyces fuscus TaxID=3048495 RepID=UPI003AFF886B